MTYNMEHNPPDMMKHICLPNVIFTVGGDPVSLYIA